MQEKLQKKSQIKQNILQVIDIKGLTKYEFYKKTGITRGILDQNNGISEENIARFLAYFTEIDANWLVTGEGNMLKQGCQDDAPNENIVAALNATIDAQRITIDTQRDTIIILKEKVSDLEDRLDKYEGGNAHAVAG